MFNCFMDSYYHTKFIFLFIFFFVNDKGVIYLTQDAARVRRHRFQQKQREDWRAKTTPVTEEELHAAE